MKRHVGQEAPLTVKTDAGGNGRGLGAKFEQVFTQVKDTQTTKHLTKTNGNLVPVPLDVEQHGGRVMTGSFSPLPSSLQNRRPRRNVQQRGSGLFHQALKALHPTYECPLELGMNQRHRPGP